MTTDAKSKPPTPESPSPAARSKKKRILPRSGRHETLEESLKRIHEQYGEALRRLAE